MRFELYNGGKVSSEAPGKKDFKVLEYPPPSGSLVGVRPKGAGGGKTNRLR